MKQHWQALLSEGLQQLELPVSQQQHEQLEIYLMLLDRWNHVYNLTSINTFSERVVRHILDSLVINPYIVGNDVLDLGTGAGLPGIPLAILNPEKQFTLLDKNGKKTRFLLQVKQTLGLENVKVINSRVELLKNHIFSSIITRAFGTIGDVIKMTTHLKNEGTHYLFMKGLYPSEELEALPVDWSVKAQALTVPGLEEQRHLIILSTSNG